MNPWQFTLRQELDVEQLIARLSSEDADGFDIVVPVHNGGAAVIESLTSVVRFRPDGVKVRVVDDASTDPLIIGFLDDLAQRGLIDLTRHASNVGYTATVNAAIDSCAGDVLLMNSDALPGPLWAQRLRWVAYSTDAVATVSALSDFAGTMSVPVPHTKNTWNESLGWEAVSRSVGREMRVWSQSVPAAHGFCLYLRRSALEEIGSFDAEAFPRGYGEEVDYSQRALSAGYVNLVAPHVIVKHFRSQSFGDDSRSKLNAASKPILRARHPGYEADVIDWELSLGDALVRTEAMQLQRRSPWLDVRARELVIDCTCLRAYGETADALDTSERELVRVVAPCDEFDEVLVASHIISSGAEHVRLGGCRGQESRVGQLAQSLLVASDPQ